MDGRWDWSRALKFGITSRIVTPCLSIQNCNLLLSPSFFFLDLECPGGGVLASCAAEIRSILLIFNGWRVGRAEYPENVPTSLWGDHDSRKRNTLSHLVNVSLSQHLSARRGKSCADVNV